MLQHDIIAIPLVEAAFFSFLFVVFHTYVGYPLLLAIWSLKKHPPIVRTYGTPGVTIVIAAWNEERHIAARIENCLQQVYPPEMLQILVVSDGSTDKTSEIVKSFGLDRVSLVELETRMGKAVALNVGVAAAQGEIIVFADARQSFSMTTVRELVANFADASVGAVSGELILECSRASASLNRALVPLAVAAAASISLITSPTNSTSSGSTPYSRVRW